MHERGYWTQLVREVCALAYRLLSRGLRPVATPAALLYPILRRVSRLRGAAPLPLAPGTSVDLCIRPTQGLIVRPDRMTARPRENLLWGNIVGEVRHAEMDTLHLRLDDSAAEYDLEIMLPGYVYHRLGLETTRRILVELGRQALHVIPRHADAVAPPSAMQDGSHISATPARR